MKVLVAAVGLLLIAAAVWVWILRPHFRSHYGGAFRGAPAVELSRLLGKPGDYLGRDWTIRGIVVRQCPHCGCWFVVADGAGRELRVEAGDLGEPIPFRAGRSAVVEGCLIRFGSDYEFVGRALEFR